VVSVSTYRPGDASQEGQDNSDSHGWPDTGQINWEGVENAWQDWLASHQARPWHELSASWGVEDDWHQNLGDADHEDTEGLHETRDGTCHEHQGLPDAVDDVPGIEGEHEDHHGPNHWDRAARDQQRGDAGRSAAADPPAGTPDHVVACDHRTEFDNAGVNSAQGGADHEHPCPPDDGTTHARHRGHGEVSAEEACQNGQQEANTTWHDTFIWSDTSTWSSVSPESHECHLPNIAPEMNMEFETGCHDSASPEAQCDWHCQDGADQLVCSPAPAADHWHAFL
jgi:hypothetical protein